MTARNQMDRELEIFLRIVVRALRELTGRLLQCGGRHPVPLRQQPKVRIAAQRSLVAELAQKVAHAGMVLHILRRQVRW